MCAYFLEGMCAYRRERERKRKREKRQVRKHPPHTSCHGAHCNPFSYIFPFGVLETHAHKPAVFQLTRFGPWTMQLAIRDSVTLTTIISAGPRISSFYGDISDGLGVRPSSVWPHPSSLHLQQSCLYVRSSFEILAVNISVYDLGRDTVQCIIWGNNEILGGLPPNTVQNLLKILWWAIHSI